MCVCTWLLVYLLSCYLQVEPNATIGEIKSMFHKSRKCHLCAGHKECELSSINPQWNKDEPILFQILSGIQPDSPFASIPVSRLGRICPLQYTRGSILSVCNPWSNCVTCLRGEVFEGWGCSAASPRWNHSHLLFQRPWSPDQLGHSEYKHTQHAKEADSEATTVCILHIPSPAWLYSVPSLVWKTMCLSPHAHLLCLRDLYLGMSPIG